MYRFSQNQDQIKMSVSVKDVVAITFMCQLLKFFICSIAQINHFVKYKNGSIIKNYISFWCSRLFKELPFYNKPIKKPKVKRLKNIDQLAERPFYEQLSIIKTNHAFKGYAISYKVEIIERKDPVVELEASKLSIKDLLSDLLNET